MRMHLQNRKLATWTGVVALLLASVGLALALDGEEPPATPSDGSVGPVVDVERATSPVATEILELHERARARQRELEAGLTSALDHAQALELQRRIQDLKLETEVEMLRIQQRHAELRGDEAAVEFLATAIRRILDPETHLSEIAESADSAAR